MSDDDFNMPSCCDMRRKVAVGIAKIFSEDECGVPDSIIVDFHDFTYTSPTNLPVAVALSFRFCPWCGSQRSEDTEKRVTEVIRPIGQEESDDDHGETWKHGTGADEQI